MIGESMGNRQRLGFGIRTAEEIANSTVYAGLVTNAFLKDPECAMQLGFAVIFDKPIILIVDRSVVLPKRLVKIADLIERVDMAVSSEVNRASDVIREFAGRYVNGRPS